MATVRPVLNQEPWSGNDAIRVLLHRFHEFAEQLSHMSSSMHDIRQSMRALAESLSAVTAGFRGVFGMGRGVMARVGMHGTITGGHGEGGGGGGSSSGGKDFPSFEERVAEMLRFRAAKMEAAAIEEEAREKRNTEKYKKIKEANAKERAEADLKEEEKYAKLRGQGARQKYVKEGFGKAMEEAGDSKGGYTLDNIRERAKKIFGIDIPKGLSIEEMQEHIAKATTPSSIDLSGKKSFEDRRDFGSPSGRGYNQIHASAYKVLSTTRQPPPVIPPGGKGSNASDDDKKKDKDEAEKKRKEANNKLSEQLGAFAQSVSIIAQQLVQAASPDLWATFTGSIQLAAIQLGQYFIPVFIQMSETLQGFADWLESWPDWAKRVAEVIASFITWMALAALAAKGLAAGAGLFGASMNPVVGLLAGAATGLALWIGSLSNATSAANSARLSKKLAEAESGSYKDAMKEEVVEGAFKRAKFNKLLGGDSSELTDKEKQKALEDASIRVRDQVPGFKNGKFVGMEEAGVDQVKQMNIIRRAMTVVKAGTDDIPDDVVQAQREDAKKKLLIALPSMKATPSYSSIEDSYKKIQLSALGADPLQMEIQRQQLMVQVKLLEKVGGFEGYVDEIKRVWGGGMG